ncbi:hypothetical protein G7046_g5688 [Stylonectria norvegica]|nr:hypothetical protein G7046_g5688 [Stylonectria norvegica]
MISITATTTPNHLTDDRPTSSSTLNTNYQRQPPYMYEYVRILLYCTPSDSVPGAPHSFMQAPASSCPGLPKPSSATSNTAAAIRRRARSRPSRGFGPPLVVGATGAGESIDGSVLHRPTHREIDGCQARRSGPGSSLADTESVIAKERPGARGRGCTHSLSPSTGNPNYSIVPERTLDMHEESGVASPNTGSGE